MARQMFTRLTDDLDGSDAQLTVRFGWDGVAYEIDLTAEHAEAFTAAVRPYLDVARRVGPSRRGRRSTTTGGSAGTGRAARPGRPVGEQSAIRDWARGNGFQLADRGRIPRRVLDAYQAAQQQGATSTGSVPTARQTRPTPARKSTGTKRTAAKATAKKTAATTATARKTAAKKATAKKATTKKATARNTAAKKIAAKKTARKTTRRARRPRATVKAS